MLSERDRRVLEAIEADLTRESPRLARLLSGRGRTPGWERHTSDALLLCALAMSLRHRASPQRGLLGAAFLTAAVAVDYLHQTRRR